MANRTPRPDYYDPNDLYLLAGDRRGQTRNDVVADAASRYLQTYRLKSPGTGIVLVIVDNQIDFCAPWGKLSVRGGTEDCRRLIEWIYDNLEKVDSIIVTLDSHYPIQIFSPGYWYDRQEKGLVKPGTVIDETTVNTRFIPRFIPEWQRDDEDWAAYYIDALKNKGKKDHRIWQYHTLIGTPGYSLVPALAEAVLFWSLVRGLNPIYLLKGTSPFTEMFSPLAAEVEVPTDSDTQLNLGIVNYLQNYRAVYIAGQAKSHCVFEWNESMLNFFAQQAVHMLNRTYLLMDAMSSVVVVNDDGSEFDFEPLIAPRYEYYKTQMGVHLVKTTDPVAA